MNDSIWCIFTASKNIPVSALLVADFGVAENDGDPVVDGAKRVLVGGQQVLKMIVTYEWDQ